MNDINYYIPISATSLSHYFSRACIIPTKFLKNKLPDIQDTLNEFILLSDRPFINMSDCSIEVVLTAKEKNMLRPISAHVNLLKKPLPISRIKTIYFKDAEKAGVTAWDINAGAAFLPEIRIEQLPYSENIEEHIKNTEIIQEKSWEEEIENFDKVLGGLALMRIAGEQGMNFSDHYFPTLSKINYNILSDLNRAINIKNKKKILRISDDSKYFGLLAGDQKWRRYNPLIFGEIKEKDLEIFSSEDKIQIQKRLGSIDFNSISYNSITYIIAILLTYGDQKSKKFEDLLSDLEANRIVWKRREEILFFFGLNKGYSSFRNKYNFNGKSNPVKYELTSKLDYYTIESVYQFVFNSKQDNADFPYLDEWCPKLYEKETINSYKILDKTVVPKKNPDPGSKEYLDQLSEETSFNDIISKLTSTIFKWFPKEIINIGATEDLVRKETNKEINEFLKKTIDKVVSDMKDLSQNEKLESDSYTQNGSQNEIIEKNSAINDSNQEPIVIANKPVKKYKQPSKNKKSNAPLKDLPNDGDDETQLKMKMDNTD